MDRIDELKIEIIKMNEKIAKDENKGRNLQPIGNYAGLVVLEAELKMLEKIKN